MSDEEGLLGRIGESPDDDLSRLVYADWLDENDRGDVAAFVRAQCRYASLAISDKARGPVRREVYRLVRDADFYWQRVLGDEVKLIRLQRGLPEAVRWNRWPTPAEMDDLLRRMPSIREIHPGHGPAVVTDDMVREATWLRRIERLDLSGTNRPESILEPFARSEPLTQMRALDLSSSFPNGPFHDLHSDIFPPGLVELRSFDVSMLDRELYRTLRNRVGVLRDLRITVGQRSLPLEETTLGTISGVGAYHLEQIHVRLRDLAVAETDRLSLYELGSRVTHLDLEMCGQLAMGLAELEFPADNRLRSLSLRSLRVSADRSEPLLHQPTLGSLRQLDLQAGLQYPYDLGIVLNSPIYARLNELNLANNSLADEWIGDALGVAPPPELTLLDLRYNNIGRRMRAALEAHFGPGICEFGS